MPKEFKTVADINCGELIDIGYDDDHHIMITSYNVITCNSCNEIIYLSYYYRPACG